MFRDTLGVLFLSSLSTASSLNEARLDCYVSPSCTATEFYDEVTGFTNDTGFAAPYSSDCCQICLPGTSPVVCFDPSDEDCQSKTGNGDYDYVLFDQIWLPEFCQSLENGFDPTLTHLAGTLCQATHPTISSPTLSIHGMWPNYVNGYPQCCDIEDGSTTALTPDEVLSWSMWAELQQYWPDVTLPAGSPCSVCLILNHEWLKHGGCYSPGNPRKYFTDALSINAQLSAPTNTINAMAGLTVSTSSIEDLYNRNINVICDPNTDNTFNGNSSIGSFLELRTCWSRENELIDCPAAFSNAFGVPCPEFTYLSGQIS